MKSKLTFLAALVAALFFVSSAAFASGTRMSSMGLTGADMMIQKDSAHWTTNPASIAYFPALITAYWDGGHNTHGGGKLLLKPVKNVEFYFLISADYNSDAFKGADDNNKPTWSNFWHMGAYEDSGLPAPYDSLPSFINNNTGLLLDAANISGSKPATLAVMMATMTFAYKINNMAFGLEGSFGYAGEDSDSALEWKVKLGTTIALSSSMSVDAAFCFGMPMLEQIGDNYHGEYTYESVNAYDLYAFARFNFQAMEHMLLHVFVKYIDADHSTNYTADNDTDIDFKRYQHKLQIGVSDEMNFSKSSLVYVGLNLNMDMQKYMYDGSIAGTSEAAKLSSDITAWTLKLHMGCEGTIIGGLKGSFGVVHDIMLYDVDNKNEVASAGDASYYDDREYNYRTDASIGLAYKIGQFLLEATINKGLFTTGPNFISGGSEDLSSSITLTYFFGETAAAPAETNEEK